MKTGALVPFLIGVACLACRHKERLAPVEFASEAGAGAIEPEDTLAPSWPTPIRADLDNGAVMHWLHEAGTPGFHLRLLVPLSGPDEHLDAAAATVTMAALRLELVRRLRRLGAEVAVANGPGRIEFVVHGQDEHAQAVLDALTQVVSERRPERALSQAQAKAASAYRPPDAAARATAGLVAGLLGLDPAREHTNASTLAGLDEDALRHGWNGLVDPRGAVLIVHAGRPAEVFTESIQRLAGTWTGRGRRESVAAVVDRVHATLPAPGRRPRAEPAATLTVLDARADPNGRGALVFGRVIPTPTARDRAYARLSQRMLQETLDARLIVSGDVAVFSVAVPISASKPGKSVRDALAQLDRFASTEHQPAHMRQAARLWLGARVVEAGLEGEDWTVLWSESIDLADADAEIAGALARDARLMLEADPGHMRKWKEKWLRPRSGEPGWTWVAAGVREDLRPALAELATTASR